MRISPSHRRHVDDNPFVGRNHKRNEMTHYICYSFDIGINHIIKFMCVQFPHFTISIDQTCVIHCHPHTTISSFSLFLSKTSSEFYKINSTGNPIPMIFGTNSFSTVARANSSTSVFDLCTIHFQFCHYMVILYYELIEGKYGQNQQYQEPNKIQAKNNTIILGLRKRVSSG